MTTAKTHEPISRKPLRLWPGVVAVTLQWLLWLGLPRVWPDGLIYAMIGGIAGGGLVVLVWWLFFSRAPQIERWGALLLLIAGAFASRPIIHESVAGGLMGMMFPFFSVPVLALALVVWAVATRNLAAMPRRVALLATVLLACGVFASVRTDGITGNGISQFAWRWAKTPEQQLLAIATSEPAVPPAPPVAAKIPAELIVARTGSESPPHEPAGVPIAKPDVKRESKEAEWPGFRGPHRDGVVPGVRIETDWAASPPVQMWRRPVGPGWSSFAVGGGLVYTQEQRGNDELVASYNLTTGTPVWRHANAARFYESNGGAGPRGTPTLSGGRVYAFGATGILNALDARNGSLVWSRNVAADAGKKIPGWGFASSPLIVNDLVIVAAGGKLAAYDLATGKPRWFGPKGGDGYSSPHLATIDGVDQVLLMSGQGAVSVAPADGKVLWEYAFATDTRIVQPALTADGDVLMAVGEAMGGGGIRRLALTPAAGAWTVQERWTSNGLKPNFNDFVVHDGHAFGFDGTILSCIDLKDGKRVWKGGRYGSGQLVLLSDQNLLVVVSEEGELALVSATPDQFKELAKFPALKDKTWNHPVVVGETLLVRNGEEMVAFRLSLAR